MNATSAQPAGLQAGSATVDISPRGSVFLYGYPHVSRYSDGVHDPLECAALYVKNGDGAALFLANDVIYVTRDLVARVRRRLQQSTGILEQAIMIATTHTHSGPIMSDHLSNAADPVLPKADPVYLHWFEDRLVAAGEAAVAAAQPAELGLAMARAEGVGSNRHDPAGPTDPDVPVLVVRSTETGRPIACLLVYGMHPTVLHEDSRFISADFPYFTRRLLRESVLTPDCAVLYLNGPSGDQSPRHVTRANTFAEAKRIGENLGRTIAAVIPGIIFQRELAVSWRRRFLEVDSRRFPSIGSALQAVERARARFAQLKAEGASRQIVRTAECDVFGAEETAELARAATDGRLSAAILACTPAEIQILQIGPWAYVGWPGEYFVEYGLELKRRSANTFLVTLANGEMQGYIVTPDAAAREVYESTNAVFAASNGPRFVEATIALLAQKSLP